MKYLNIDIRGSILLSVICFAALLTGCEQAEPVAYTIPKESREVAMPDPVPSAHAPSAPSSSNMQVLPGMEEAANEAGQISYTTPEGWSDLPASGIRKAFLQVSGDAGTADLTITAFPGDVGGMLANINRWAGQIGIEPLTPEQAQNSSEQITIFQHGAIYVRLDGINESIRAAIMPFHGYSWFIKFQGPRDTVDANEADFKGFLDSIVMEGHSH